MSSNQEDFYDTRISEEELGDLLESGDVDELMDRLAQGVGNTQEIAKYPEGLRKLIEGYLAYCSEVIINRAIPAIDGLKPVQRRILYTLAKHKIWDMEKSLKTAGLVLAFHPHSDKPIYKAMVRMTDKRALYNIPLLKGKGEYGSNYSSLGASAARYTEICLHSNSEDYFGEMNGVEYSMSYDDRDKEPNLLPVSYPSILVNATEGIAVGLASNIPSFNILDVLDLTIEYLETGDVKTVIYPDFPTGGFYIKNDAELHKLMTTGRADIKLRGRVEISEKDIIIREVPYSVVCEKIYKQIIDANITGVSDVKNLMSKEGCELTVSCSAANRVEGILLALYKYTDLQYTMTTNMNVIVDNEPRLLGVWDIIKKWCEFRKNVIVKQLEFELAKYKSEMKNTVARLKLLERQDVCNEYISKVRSSGKKVARQILVDAFPDMDSSEIAYIARTAIEQLGDIEELRVEVSKIDATVADYNHKIANPGLIAIEQLKSLKRKFARCQRLTEVTDLDYVFEKETEQNIIDNNPCIILYKDGFIKKLTSTSYYDASKYDLVINTESDKTLIGIDTDGRVLRIYLNELPYCTVSDVGTYLPKYWNIPENELVSLELLENKEKMLIYKDGKIGFIHYGEWYNNSKQIRVIERGISTEADKLVDVVDTPDVLAIITNKQHFGMTYSYMINKLSRKARTSVFKLDNDEYIEWYAPLSHARAVQTIMNHQSYIGKKVGYLKNNGDIVSYEDFIRV